MDGETVIISKAELAELEELRKLKADLPRLLEKAKEERDTERLKDLAKRNKENPEKHREQSKKLYHLKKEEINAKRREAYRLKKETLKVNSPGRSSEPSDDFPGH